MALSSYAHICGREKKSSLHAHLKAVTMPCVCKCEYMQNLRQIKLPYIHPSGCKCLSREEGNCINDWQWVENEHSDNTLVLSLKYLHRTL